jgi:FMN reductase [NAD(P)H]
MKPSLNTLLAARYGIDLGLRDGLDASPEISRILSRRTHRSYAPKSVPDDLVDCLLATAFCASSKSDFQQASVIRLKDPHKRGKIAARFPDMPWIGNAPVFLIFCADARRLESICAQRGHPQDNGDLEAFLNASVDAALVMQTFILAAELVDLGCCPISVIRNQIETVAAVLELPDGVFPVAGLCVGYPSSQGYVSMRLPPKVTVHVDRYDDSGLDTEIDAYDRRRDARHSIPTERQRNPKSFGYADFYGWSEDKARQAAEPEGASFSAYVKAHGFSF